MRKYRYCFAALSIFAVIGIFFTPSNSLSKFEATAKSDPRLSSLALGPGITNLSLGDAFATYQWGLQNDGEFRLTELTANFESLDALYKSKSDSSLGLPKQIGPGDFNTLVRDAIPGVDINIRPAWELYNQKADKRDVVIALIDTGMDFNHQELRNACWVNPDEFPGDGIDNDANGYIDDIYGWNFYSGSNAIYTGSEDSHGTHAAGTIAAARSSHGIAGITDNHHVKIMSLKALGGSDGTGSPSSVVEAIHYAEQNGATICNLSLGSLFYSKVLAEAIEQSNMLFVIASGNGDRYGIGYDTDRFPVYPAALPYDNIISVANLLFDGDLSTSSNYGATSVDIAAPGSYILSTVPEQDYAFMSGTSMAAPMVTGVAAMLYSYHTDIDLSMVRQILLESSRKTDRLSGKISSGGILDAYAALTYKKQG